MQTACLSLTLAIILSLGVCLGATAQRQAPARPPGWCVDPGHAVDSSFAAGQAIRALTDSNSKRAGLTFKVNYYQVVAEGQGVAISVVPASRPLPVGGGGLVWVDLETGCPIILRHYE